MDKETKLRSVLFFVIGLAAYTYWNPSKKEG